MVAPRITGREKLALVGKAVRKLGADRTIIKNLAKRVRKLSAPIRQEIKASALANLPSRGGLNLWVSQARVNVAVRRGEKTAGVNIVVGRNSGGRRSDLNRLDQGEFRHPTYGHKPWTLQSIEPGFASDVMEGPVANQWREETLGAIDDAIAEVLRAI